MRVTPADVERQVADVARALHQRGSTGEGVTLLRGALRRDQSQRSTRELLEVLSAGGSPSASGVVEFDLGLVDGWIRRGMLVEALALLGGTSLGSRELGREWANLLGELLAPVPVEAEAVLVEMYEQLLSGGASVALTLLEERDRQQPAMPAWATRRLELLRWMLLDNAEVAHSFSAGDHLSPSELAGVLEVAERKGLRAGHVAVKAFVEMHPGHADGARTLEALENILGDLDRQASLLAKNNKTMPMVGHTAALMQLRMGNLRPAAKVYASMVEGGGDDRASSLLSEVQVLLRVLDGQPADGAFEPLEGEVTQLLASGPGTDQPFPDDEPTTSDPSAAVIATAQMPRFELPKSSPSQQEGGHPAGLGPPVGVDLAPTTQQPAADRHAEKLVAQGRLEEAEALYHGLLDVAPERTEWQRRIVELRGMREHRDAAPAGVLVRIIVPVK